MSLPLYKGAHWLLLARFRFGVRPQPMETPPVEAAFRRAPRWKSATGPLEYECEFRQYERDGNLKRPQWRALGWKSADQFGEAASTVENLPTFYELVCPRDQVSSEQDSPGYGPSRPARSGLEPCVGSSAVC